MRKLNFYRDVFGGWRWEYFDADGEAHDSPFSYDSHLECVEDARRQGMTGSPPRAYSGPRAAPVALAPAAIAAPAEGLELEAA